MTITRIPRSLYWLILALVLFVFVLGESAVAPSRVGAAGGTPVTGWAWSQYLGWISFSSTNPGAGGGQAYGVSEDTNGNLSGYAWSSNLGWISFDDVAGCPQSPCAPKINPGNGRASGWARACAAFANKNACSGALDANSGGWDGWISLSGDATDGSSYGIIQRTDGVWSGYAWGSDAIGAIAVNGTGTYGSQNSVQISNPRVVNLTADDFEIDSGASTILRWTPFSGATSCNFTPTTNPLYRPGGYNAQTSTSVSTGPLTENQAYTVTCTDASGPPVQSNPISITVRQPIVSIRANPTRYADGI